jgi:predicted transcriptional regulator
MHMSTLGRPRASAQIKRTANIVLGDDDFDCLKELGERLDVSRSEIIRRAIRQFAATCSAESAEVEL